MSGSSGPAPGTGVSARTFLASHLSAHRSSPACTRLDQMIPEDRVKIVLAPGQTLICSVLLLAQLERLLAKDGKRNQVRAW